MKVRLATGPWARTAVRRYFAPWRIATLTLVLVIGAAQPLRGQLSRVDTVKKAPTNPDTVTLAKDSMAQAARPAADSAKPKRSFLSKAMSAAASASDKMEKTTGISAKDAALAASGAAIAGLVAKKAGLPNPGNVAGDALKNAAGKALRHKLEGKASGVSGNVMGQLAMPTSPGATPSAAAMNNAIGGNTLFPAGAGTPADAAAMLAFQQAMMQTAMAASAGDATARARMDAWQALALKYQAEAARLTTAAAAGDMAAVQRLQELQLTMIKEWTGAQNVRPKLVKP